MTIFSIHNSDLHLNILVISFLILYFTEMVTMEQQKSPRSLDPFHILS